MASILTVYYSRKGENYWDGQVLSLAKGNTEVVAEMIHRAIGGDLFEIDTASTYPADYTACTKVAKAELNANARPKLKVYMESLGKYDVIFVGYPNWYGTCPMAVFSFLEHYNLNGKKIIPFCTHEGSGMGNSEQDLKKICVGADVMDGLAIRGYKAVQSENFVLKWIRNLEKRLETQNQ